MFSIALRARCAKPLDLGRFSVFGIPKSGLFAGTRQARAVNMSPSAIVKEKADHAHIKAKTKTKAAVDFAQQAERLGQYSPSQENDATGSTQAVEAKFVTPHDAVIQTADGGRLPAVPLEEAVKLNELRDMIDEKHPSEGVPKQAEARLSKDGSVHGSQADEEEESPGEGQTDTPLEHQKAPSKTNPLFPPLPLYGPPTLMRQFHCWLFRVSSSVLSLCFLLVIILGALFTSIPVWASRSWMRLTFRNPDKKRPFYQEEEQRRKARRLAEKAWKQDKHKTDEKLNGSLNTRTEKAKTDEFPPLEGGPDKIPCDVRYYARRVVRMSLYTSHVKHTLICYFEIRG
jgi:hypothetical protein